jgi:cytochrome c554/c'-like protein
MSAARCGAGVLCLCLLARAADSPAACAPCHRAETEAFAASAMSRALSPAASSVLRANPKLTAQIGPYSYELSSAGGEPVLAVSDSGGTLRVPIAWAFGQGAVGQTFVFRLDGRWYESRVSWFSALPGLDLTMGAQNIAPHTLLEAAGRLVSPSEMGKCFDCHATNVAKSPDVASAAMIPGIQCERCHGPSKAHLDAVRGGPPAAMRKLGALAAGPMSDFCGQCHRTWSQIASAGPRGIENVRFQPYRLANSKCFDGADPRIRCTACHNPHRDLETSAAGYDARCAACHATTARHTKAAARVCRVSARLCVTCHMPRLDLPGAHRQFTDHWIRIARANQPYPD